MTGGATGIGAAAVQVFLAAGADVHAIYHRSPPPDDLEAARWHQCDLRERDVALKTFAEATEAMGGLDVLLHAAGLWQPSRPESVMPDDLDFLLATNFKATVFANQAAYEQMKDVGGAIVNLGSSEGVSGNPLSALYASTKAAVHAWTRSAARAWGPNGVTVNSVAPIVETRSAGWLRDYLGPEAAATFDESLKTRFAIRGTFGDPVEDLGPMLVFLAGTGARFITGQLLAVNGGLLMLGA